MKAVNKLIKIVFLLIMNLLFIECCWSIEKSDSLISESYRLISIGNELASKNFFNEAEKCFYSSIEIWKHIEKYDEYMAYPYYSLARLYEKTGDYQKCLENYSKAENILLNARDEYKFLLGGLYTSMGIFFQSYGDYVKAHFYLDNSIKILSGLKYRNETNYSNAIYAKAHTFYYQKKYQLSIDLSESYLKEKNPVNKNQFEQLIGNCLLYLRKYDQAISLMEVSLAGLKNEHERYGEAMLNIAKACLITRDLNKADDFLKKAYSILKMYKSETDPWTIYYYDLLGQLNMAKANSAGSISLKQDYLGKAFKIFDKGLLLNSNSSDGKIPYLDGNKGDFITPTQVKDLIVHRAEVLGKMAENYKNDGNIQLSKQFFDLSLNTWEAAVHFFNDFRVSFLEEESKLTLSEAQVNIYTEGFTTAMKLFETTGLETYFRKMLFFSESGKSSTFLASLNAVHAENFGGIPDSLLRSEKELNIQLSNLKQLIYNEQNVSNPDTVLIRDWENKQFNLQKLHDELIFRFERSYPNYYSFKYNQNAVSISEIQSKLKRGEALIEYFVDEPVCDTDSGKINALLFTKSDYSVHSTNINSDYIKNVQALLDQLTNRNIGETNLVDFKKFINSSSYLYSLLIEPLGIKKSITNLVIIPDGKLAYLPFDVLIKSKPDSSRISFSKPDYLVRHFSMVYSYSATLHFNYFNSKKRSKGNILAFAPDYPEEGKFDLYQSAYRNRRGQQSNIVLRPLPGANEEVINLSKYHNCKSFTGNEATESAFKREAANYDILHLAMHTIMNDSIPMFSKLVFSCSTDTINDGYLNTQEIYNMNLNARLVVLSACNTGSGQMRTGEGVMSMARAFLYAGCPSIVMTLWEVEDKSSAKLMLNFYRFLFRGYSKPEALQKAKLEHLKNADPLKAHPYFWMGYIIVGNPSPLKFPDGVVICLLIFGIVLTVFLFFGKKALRRKMDNRFRNW
jgi:CHAT domain-containing protein